MSEVASVVPDYGLKPEPQTSREDAIRELAYLKWQAATGGNTVSQEDTDSFWLQAEQEIDNDGQPT